MATVIQELSPHDAYVLAETQKEQAGKDFLRQIADIYARAKANPGGLPVERGNLSQPEWERRVAACREFVAGVDAILGTPQPGEAINDLRITNAIRKSYREIATKYGLKQIASELPNFENNLCEFHKNYVINFPIKEEQESLEGFRDLWSAPQREDGYKEAGYSIICPLTGKYLMGVNFTLQPESNSIHFIYGFVMPWARRAIGFSDPLLQTMRGVATNHFEGYFAQHPDKRPSYYDSKGPMLAFEKNILGEMTLRDILMDTAGIDINDPPKEGVNLALSSIGQSMRDLIWSRLGGKIVDYKYIQSSLDGVVEVPEEHRVLVIKYLINDLSLTDAQRNSAETILNAALGEQVAGCTVLNLCVFAPPGMESIPAAQVEDHNRIFQGTSVIKDPENIQNDVYYQAQMASLKQNTDANGQIALIRIQPTGPGIKDFLAGEQLTKEILKTVTWDELRQNADRPYSEWIDEKINLITANTPVGTIDSRKLLPANDMKPS